MFGRRKKKDAEVDWTSGLGQTPVPAPGPPSPSTPVAISSDLTNLPAGMSFQVVQPTPEQITEAMQMAERFMGRDLDGDGKVAGAAPQAAGDTVVDQLERLAKLHASGALTDDEFAAEKRKVLGA